MKMPFDFVVKEKAEFTVEPCKGVRSFFFVKVDDDLGVVVRENAVAVSLKNYPEVFGVCQKAVEKENDFS